MSAPYEVVMAVANVWVAPVGTTFPATNASPSGSWLQLGTAGNKNFDEPGVVITHNQQVTGWKSAGSTADRKAVRSSESLMVELSLVDLTLEQYAKVINNATVTVTAGPPATKSIPLLQGVTVNTFAVLVRAPSSYNDALTMQFQLNSAYNASSPKPSFQKDKPAALDVQLVGLDDASASPWTLIAQTA